MRRGQVGCVLPENQSRGHRVSTATDRQIPIFSYWSCTGPIQKDGQAKVPSTL